MADYTEEELMNMDMKELEALYESSGPDPEPATADYTEEELMNMDMDELAKLSGEYEYAIPGTNMYDKINQPGQSLDEAMEKSIALRNKYRNTPHSEEGLAGPTYKGYSIPPVQPSTKYRMHQLGELYGKTPVGWALQQLIPDQHLRDTQVSVPRLSTMGRALWNMPFEMAEASNAVGDAVGITEGATERFQDMRENYAPEINVQGADDQFMYEATQAIPAVLAASPITKPLYAYLTSVAVGAVTRDDKETEKFMFGKDSFLGWEVGDKVFGDETEAAKVMANRLDLALDDSVIGGLAEAGIKSSIFIGKYAYALTAGKAMPFFSKNGRHMKIMESIVSTLKLVDGETDPKRQAQLLQQYADLVRRNAKMFDDIPMEELNEVNATIVKRLQDKGIKISPMTALKMDESLPMGTRQGAEFLHTKANQATAEMPDILRGTAGEVSEGLGGVQAAEAVPRVLDDAITSQVDEATEAAAKATTAAEGARKDLVSLIKTNKDFSKALEKAGARSNIFTNKLPNQSMDDLVTQTVDAYNSARNMLSMKRQAADAASKSGKNNILMENMTGIETALSLAKDSKSVSTQLQRRIDSAGKSAIDWMMEVRPKLSSEIGRLRKLGEDPEDLVALKKAIDSGIDQLAASSGPKKSALGTAFNDFMDHYKNKYINVWGDGVLGDVADILFDANNLKPVLNEAGEEVGKQVVHKKTRTAMMKAIRSQIGGKADPAEAALLGPQFVKDMRDAGQSTDNISDYIIGTVFNEWKRSHATGKDIGELNVDALADSLTQWADALEEAAPGTGKRIGQFIDDMYVGKKTIKTLDDIAADKVKYAEGLDSGLKGGKFSEFYTPTKDPVPGAPAFELKDSGMKSLRAVMTDKDAPLKKLDELLELTDSPDTRRGLQVAWIDEFLNKAFKDVDEASIGNMKGILNDANVDSFLKVGDKIFEGEDKFLLELLRAATKDTVVEQTNLGKQLMSALSPQRFDTDVAGAAHVLVTWTLGVLNRTAARARSAAGAALKSNPVKEDVLKFYERVLTDPEFFSQQLEELSKVVGKKSLRSQQAKKILIETAAKVGNVGDSTEEYPMDFQTTEDLINQIENERAFSE